MVVRVLYPLGVYYQESVGYRNLVASTPGDALLRAGNRLGIDALEYIEVSCCNGNIRRLCTRVSVFVPWTPVLYVAVRPGYAAKLRQSINLTLCAHYANRYTDSVVSTEHCSLNGFVQRGNAVLWLPMRMSLHELRFDSFQSRSIALHWLRDNVTGHSTDYALFASLDSTCLEVAMSSYFRVRRREPTTSAKTTTTSGKGAVPPGAVDTIDLNSVFELGVWCCVDDQPSCELEQFLCKLSTDEIAANYLSANPWLEVPVVSYDLETVARLDSTLPRGSQTDQCLSSVAITVHVLRSLTVFSSAATDKTEGASTTVDEYDTYAFVFAYVPLCDGDDEERAQRLERYREDTQRRLRQQPDMRTTVVRFFQSERDLLFNVLDVLATNEFFVPIFRLDDQREAKLIASVLIGYNSWGYDFTFLYTRAFFHAMYIAAYYHLRSLHEPRFCPTQISFDLILHVKARYGAQLGSVALKNVSRYFGATDAAERSMDERSRRVKMNFDAVAIRRLYYNGGRTGTGETDDDREHDWFDEQRAFGDPKLDEGLSMLRVLTYNVRDCTAVYYLMRNMFFMQTVVVYAGHFYVPFKEAANVGNSRLLPNSLTTCALRQANTIIPYRHNRRSMFTLPKLECGVETMVVAGPMRHQRMQRQRNNAIPCTPGELWRWYVTQQRAPSASADLRDESRVTTPSSSLIAEVTNGGNVFTARVTDTLSLMRISSDRLYIGGINSATTGHIARPICVDFTSFYPSIGCQYSLSTETVFVITVEQLLCVFQCATMLDNAIAHKMLRCFDYEPPDSPNLSPRCRVQPQQKPTTGDCGNSSMREYVIRGRDDLSASVIRYNCGWYEGVELSNSRELIESSADVSRRRVLVVYNAHGGTPIICSLWQYYLTKRGVYKSKLRDLNADEADAVFLKRAYGCMEKMYKVIANSLYGYLNYQGSVIYAPGVAAAVTLLSRKTFYETSWLCERAIPMMLILRENYANAVASNRRGGDGGDGDEGGIDAVQRSLVGGMSRSLRRIVRTLYPRSMVVSKRCVYADDADRGEEHFTRAMGKLLASFRREQLPASQRTDAAVSYNALRCSVMYRDTDGLIMYLMRRLSATGGHRAITNAEQKVYEPIIVRTINETFRRYGYTYISLALEDNAVSLCTIMGKKKYWKVLNDRFVTKGFEKNAQPFVKHIVSSLQRNIADLVSRLNVATCRLVLRDFDAFFGGMFTALRLYDLEHGAASFAFNMILNPRSVSGAESRFIQRTIERYNYSPGDRVACLFALNRDNPTQTRFLLLNEYNARQHEINYYKIIRRLATYFVQLVEGFKRHAEPISSPLCMTAKQFDVALRSAYVKWLAATETSPVAAASVDEDPLFRRNSEPLTVERVSYLSVALAQ